MIIQEGSVSPMNGAPGRAAQVEFGDMVGLALGNTGHIVLDEDMRGTPDWIITGAQMTWTSRNLPGPNNAVNLRITSAVVHAKFDVDVI